MFITFEGIDGSGKSAICRNISEKFKEAGMEIYIFREPGGTDISEQIRAIIGNEKNKNMTLTAEALLFAASREQLLQEKIIPLLKQNKIVLCDRYFDSSIVYQGQLGLEFLKNINPSAVKTRPDITILLDVNAETAQKRVAKRYRKDRLDELPLKFYENARERYLKIANSSDNKDRYIVIEDAESVVEKTNKVFEMIKKHLPLAK